MKNFHCTKEIGEVISRVSGEPSSRDDVLLGVIYLLDEKIIVVEDMIHDEDGMFIALNDIAFNALLEHERSL